jgi:hypothetical protein
LLYKPSHYHPNKTNTGAQIISSSLFPVPFPTQSPSSATVPLQDSNASNWNLATRTMQALNSIIPAELSGGAIAGIVIGTARVIVLISVTASVVFVRTRVSHFAMSSVTYRTNSPIAEQNFFYRNETEALQW